MDQELNAQGICGTCIYRSKCLSMKNNMKERKPVLQCEEFDDSESKKEVERRWLLSTFATLPCFSMKNLIPGWES